MGAVKALCSEGFTLIEMTIVTFILATISLIVAPSIVGSTNGVKATSIIRIADQATTNWFFLTSQAGSPTTTMPNQYGQYTAIMASALGANGIMFIGRSHVSPYVVAVYDRLGIRPLSDLVSFDASTQTFSVIGIPNSTVAMSGGGLQPVVVNFTNIPYDIFKAVFLRLKPNSSPVLGASTTVGSLTYYCASTTAACSSMSIAKAQ